MSWVRAPVRRRRQHRPSRKRNCAPIACSDSRHGARENRRAFVDLIERVGADDDRIRFRVVHHGLRDRKQRLASAGDRDYLPVGVDRLDAVAPPDPVGDRDAQRLAADRGRIDRETVQIRDQRFLDEGGGRMFRFADVEIDELPPRRRL